MWIPPAQGSRISKVITKVLESWTHGQSVLFCWMELPPQIRVLIADDYYVFRQAIKVMLSFESDMEVVAEATNGRQTVDLALKFKPTAVVMDLSMGGLNGVEVIRQILAELPDTKILVLSGQADRRVIDEVLSCGAVGFLTKSGSLRDVPIAVRELCKGKSFVSLQRASGEDDAI